MYRFRSVENLLGRKELENQQIYLAPPSQLNDPMEGERQYFWKGDKIVWVNFLKHFVLCLEGALLVTRLIDEDEELSMDDINVWRSVDDLPTDMYRKRIEDIYEVFFSDEFIEVYLEIILNNPWNIYSDELYVHLSILLTSALNAIFKIDERNGFPSIVKNKKENKVENLIGQLDFNELYKNEVEYNEIMQFLSKVQQEKDFQQNVSDIPKKLKKFFNFPKMYIEALKKLNYPISHIACFMDNCTDASIWGSYGDNHKGVCLKYRIDDQENPTLKLKVVNGYGSGSYSSSNINFKLKKVEYSTEFLELNFFENIGNLPVNKLIKQWYSDENGNKSIYGVHLTKVNKEIWRKKHWRFDESAYLKKLPDWEYEKEYRIVLSDILGIFEEPENRLVEYSFEDLEAIIFGIKTPDEDRKKIVDIVKEKCKENKNIKLDFYLMSVSKTAGKMEMKKIMSV